MRKVDVAVVLGGQIICDSETGEFAVAPHRKIRVEAAIEAYRKGLASRFIVCGGYNFGIRYDLNSNELLAPANFSFEKMALARNIGPSEAQIFKKEMSRVIPEENILVEELSTTTRENAACVAMILSRTLADGVAGTDTSKLRGIGLITQAEYINRAVEEFGKAGVQVVPMPAEKLTQI